MDQAEYTYSVLLKGRNVSIFFLHGIRIHSDCGFRLRFFSLSKSTHSFSIKYGRYKLGAVQADRVMRVLHEITFRVLPTR